MYSIWDGVDTLAALEELAQDFVDQTAFMEYFKASWVPKIGMISLSLSLSLSVGHIPAHTQLGQETNV